MEILLGCILFALNPSLGFMLLFCAAGFWMMIFIFNGLCARADFQERQEKKQAALVEEQRVKTPQELEDRKRTAMIMDSLDAIVMEYQSRSEQ